LGFPRPEFPFSRPWLYLIAEATLVLSAIFVAWSSVIDTLVIPLPDLEKHRILFGSFYLALAVLGPPVILSILLDRPRAGLSHRFVLFGILIVIVAPVADITIFFFRIITGING
jgi:hypothetical protein